MNLDRAKPNSYLSPTIFSQTKDFYREKLRFDTSLVFDSIYYQQLKPRLKKAIMAHIFSYFDEYFIHLMEQCSQEFKNEVYKNARYNFFAKDCIQKDDESGKKRADQWFSKDTAPALE